MEYVALIGAGLQICLLIMQEYFSATAKAKEANIKFNLDQDALKKIVASAVLKWNSSNSKDSSDAGNAWDQADKKD